MILWTRHKKYKSLSYKNLFFKLKVKRQAIHWQKAPPTQLYRQIIIIQNIFFNCYKSIRKTQMSPEKSRQRNINKAFHRRENPEGLLSVWKGMQPTRSRQMPRNTTKSTILCSLDWQKQTKALTIKDSCTTDGSVAATLGIQQTLLIVYLSPTFPHLPS